MTVNSVSTAEGEWADQINMKVGKSANGDRNGGGVEFDVNMSLGALAVEALAGPGGDLWPRTARQRGRR
jgi:hypothetical protein